MFKTIRDIPEKAAFLMTPPDNFRSADPDAKPPGNDFSRNSWTIFTADPSSYRKKAHQQWQELRRVIEGELDARIFEIAPKDGLKSQVFSADPSLTVTDNAGRSHTILSQFSNDHRNAEVPSHRQFFEVVFPSHAIVKAEYNIEGSGDNLYDPYRKLFWSGFTENPGNNTAEGRSDIRSHEQLATLYNKNVVDLKVCRPFFHIDTTLTPLSNGHMLFHENGVHPDYHETLFQKAFDAFNLPRDEFLIRVDKEDAKHFACNLICQGTTIIMPYCSDGLQAILKQKGYRVVTVDVSHFIMAGGGPHCMVNNIKTGL